MPSEPSSFIVSLPKAELHLHLEGSIVPSTLLELRQRHNMDGASLAEVEQLYNYKDFGVSLLWIFDTVRQFGAEKAQSVLDLAIQFHDRNVVAFGIGGDEHTGPPEWFAGVYPRAAEHGLHLTAHAGENAGPESIWGALNLKAERIGHGLTAGQDPELIEELAERQIPIEICLTSNLRTGCCADLAQHPVKRFFDQGLMLTLNTDDPAMFDTSLVDEYQLVQDTFGFTDEHLRELARNSFEASFLPAEKKVRFLDLLDATALHS